VEVDLDKELVADGPKEPFDLPPPFGAARPGVDQLDPKNSARPEQRGGNVGGAVVDIMPMSA
jgi:hypothetical protein